MTNKLTISIAQQNYVVGDIEGNYHKALEAREWALKKGADLIVFPELSVTGYPPEDLVLRPEFQRAAMEKAQKLAKVTSDGKTAMLVGCPWLESGKVYNAALLLTNGEIKSKQYKYDLPNYGVFDEKRVFLAGEMPQPVEFNGVRLGIMICEDMWNMKVTDALKDSDILISMNASPFEIGKHKKRVERALMNIRVIRKPLIYVNQICGQDDLVFDGDSFVISEDEKILLRLPGFREYLEVTEWENKAGWQCKSGNIETPASEEERIYKAMMLGLKDYVEKNKFPGVVIGLSGGIDSALTAAVAVDALGKEKVRLVMMPSRYTSAESLEDAQFVADALGVKLENISIEDAFSAFEDMLAPTFSGRKADITEENLQSRIRGNILMAISNKFGHMVVSTGNKSEMSVGYATLYGDMCGGYSVLKDVYKMQVYAVSRWRNENKPQQAFGPEGVVINKNIITKAPTAELKPNQKDEDSLPPYEILDGILEKLVEQELSVEEIITSGYERAVVEKVYRMLHAAEYKRRQSPPGVKISKKPFSRDRRYPITNKFSG